MFEDYYPIYVEDNDDVPRHERCRANDYNDLMSELADADRGARNPDYYIVDPFHEVSDEGNRNICDPDDEDDKRVFTLALLAPHVRLRNAHVPTVASMLDVRNTTDRVHENDDVFYEWKRARAKLIPDDSPWSVESNERVLTTDAEEETIIRASRAANFQYKNDLFDDELMDQEFGINHVNEMLRRFRFPANLDPSDYSMSYIEGIVATKTAHPRPPHRPAYRDIIAAMCRADDINPASVSREQWLRNGGYKGTEWSNLLQDFEGYHLFDKDRLEALKFGDDLEDLYTDVLGEVFPRYLCGGCGQVFERRDDLTKHTRKNCPESSPEKAHCAFCDETFEGENAIRSLASHRRAAHPLDAKSERRKPENRHEYLTEEDVDPADRINAPLHSEDEGLAAIDGGTEYVAAPEIVDDAIPDETPPIGPDAPAKPDTSDTGPGTLTPPPNDRMFGLDDEHAESIADTVFDTLGVNTSELVNQMLGDATDDERDEVLMALFRDDDVSDDTILAFREAERE